MRKQYDIYLAGPFFNDAQKARMDSVKNILIELGYDVADPRELGPIIVDTANHVKTPEFFAEIFDGNIEGMNDSFMMVASIDDKDTGTAFEIGWAYGTGMLLFTFAFDGGKTNVMLGQAVDGHFTSAEEFKEFFAENLSKIKNCASAFMFGALKKAEADE